MNKMPLQIETARLLLRAITVADVPVVFENISSDPDVARYMSWPRTDNIEDIRAFVSSAVGWWSTPTTAADFVYVITVAATGGFVGMCSIGPHHGQSFHWGMGYNLAKRCWGRGYGTEAVSAMVQQTFLRSEVHRISAVVDLENPASARVLEKSGLQREGILRKYSIHPNTGPLPRDVYLYAATR